MTTAAFNRINPHVITALSAVKTQYCAPPHFAPAEPVSAQMTCPRCGSRLNFTVSVRGQSDGRCVTADCIRWACQ